MAPVDDGSLAMVCFHAAGRVIAVEARQVAALRTSPVADAMAIEALMGLPDAAPGSERRWLTVLGASGAEHAVEVGHPVSMADVPTASIFPLPVLVQARQTLRGVVAISLDNDAGPVAGAATLIVDLHRLIAA